MTLNILKSVRPKSPEPSLKYEKTAKKYLRPFFADGHSFHSLTWQPPQQLLLLPFLT